MEAEAVTPCGAFFLAMCVLLTALYLAGFWVCREDDTPEAFCGERTFLTIISAGTFVVCWIVVLVTLAGRGEF
jgi:hypothetical protein